MTQRITINIDIPTNEHPEINVLPALTFNNKENKPLTFTEAVKKLGLKSFDEIISEALDKGHYPRASGRTTAILIKAALLTQEGTVLILSTRAMNSLDLQRTAKEYATKLGLNPENIIEEHLSINSFDDVLIFRGHKINNVLFDNVVTDMDIHSFEHYSLKSRLYAQTDKARLRDMLSQ